MPRWRVSTREAFARIDRGMRKGLTPWRRQHRFAATLGRQGLRATEALRLGNTFEQVLGAHRQEFETLCARLRAAGALEPRLPGGGSAVFGLVPQGGRSQELVGRYSGNEPLFVVRSAGSGMLLRTQP